MTTAIALRLVPPPQDDGMTFLERYEIYMQGAGHSDRTIDESLQTIRRLEMFVGEFITDVAAIDVSRFLGRRDIGPSTRNTYHGQLGRFFKWLDKNGGSDVMKDLPAPRKPRGVPHPVSNDGMPRLLAQRMHKRTRVMILLAALAGLRVHEIAKIRGDHINPIARTLRVTGKGNVTATLPLHPALVEAFYSMPRTGYWFPSNSTRDGHVLAKSVGSIIKQVMVRADVPGTAHSLRHWYGTMLVQSGVDLRTTQTLLRHASLQTTEIYVQVTDSNRASAIDLLDPFGGGSLT